MSTVSLKATREHRVTVPALARRKRRGEKIVMLTAYDFTFAQIFDGAEIDILLVGDSLGNVMQGHQRPSLIRPRYQPKSDRTRPGIVLAI